MRVEPRAISELLHRQIDPDADRDVLGKGLRRAQQLQSRFSAEAAQAHASRELTVSWCERDVVEDAEGNARMVGVVTKEVE